MNSQNLRIFVCLFLFCVFVVPLLAGRDYYEILGVTRQATQREIKKAHKNLSLKLHPDKNPGDKAAADKYLEIQSAYEVLSDEEKRRKYDMYGEDGLKETGHGGHGGFSMDDLFESFGFGGRKKRRGEYEMPKSPTLTIPLEVTLKDLYLGKTIEASHSRQVTCHHCRGTGAENPDDVTTCPVCKGSGTRIQVQQLGPGFVSQTQTTCDKCGGKGKIVSSTCHHCHGTKVEQDESEMTIVIEKGMTDGSQITFHQEGDVKPDHLPGDIVFKVVTVPHKRFTRKGDDLYYKTTISLLEALVGFKKTIRHLDGHEVLIERDEVTIPGFVLQITGEGMPMHEFPTQKGNLFVEFTVKFPPTVTAQQKAELERLFPK